MINQKKQSLIKMTAFKIKITNSYYGKATSSAQAL